jgi:hypothetical protein
MPFSDGREATTTSSGFEYLLRLNEHAGISTAVASTPMPSTEGRAVTSGASIGDGSSERVIFCRSFARLSSHIFLHARNGPRAASPAEVNS